MANISAAAAHLRTTPLVANHSNESPYSRDGYWLSKRRDGRSANWMIARWQDSNRCIVYKSCRTDRLDAARTALDAFVDARGATRETVSNRKPVDVYFIQAETGQIKIGVAEHVERRLNALRMCSPVPLKVLATTPGAQQEEFAYHRQFAAHRLHGEWFSPAPEILAEIDRLNAAAQTLPTPPANPQEARS